MDSGKQGRLNQPSTDYREPIRGVIKPIRESSIRAGWAGRLNLRTATMSFGLLCVVLVVAEFAADQEWITPLIMPAPTDVGRALWDGITSGVYSRAAWATFWPTSVGFVLSATASIAFGAALGSAAPVRRVLMPFIIAFQSMPKIAIAPIIVLWLGFGPTSKVTIVAIVAFFPVLISTLQGVVLRERERVELLHVLGATRSQILWYLRLPSAIPYIFGGLRIGAIFALIGAVVAEFVGSSGGLGYLLLQQRALFNVPGQYAALLLLMIIGIFLNFVMGAIERKVAFWAAEAGTSSP